MTEIDKIKTAQFINELFIEIKARCPAWPQSWPNAEIEKKARQIWLQEIVKHKISSWEHIKKGLEKIKSSFVPDIDEFIQYCKPTLKDFGLPEPYVAFREACKNGYDMKYGEHVTWSHPAVFHAGSETGWFNIEKSEKLFLANYEMTCRIVFEGGALRDLPKLIPKQPLEKSSPEIASKSLDEIKKILGLKDKKK